MAGKKKSKSTSSQQQQASSSKSTSKKPTRGTSGKQSSASAANAKSAEGESVTYGVVPSEYNIQAQIDWLTAPPSSGDKKNPANSLPPPSKKPQRGYHHDVCDGCGEGEYLMYCDKCPAAYHCICDDPPLPPEDYETIGINWKCKKCRIKVESGNDEAVEEMGGRAGDGSIKGLFGKLVTQTHAQNPVQFKLPKEYPAYDYPFPGTSRHVLKKARQRTSVVEVENGVIPKPTVLCFHCALSCRVGALIQCDKCDLYFHLDCLDPPLTTIPTTVWICPLHVEPHLEAKQLSSIALSERVKIWEQAETPVNRPAVILDFVHKAKKSNPMFRRKQPIPMLSNASELPEMVDACYKDTIDAVNERFGSLNALAYVCEMEKLNVEMKHQVDIYREKMTNEYLPAGKSLVEQRAKLEFLRSRNISKLNHLRNVFEMYLRNRELQSADVTSSGPSPPKTPKVYESVSDILQEMDQRSTNGEECEDSKESESKETKTEAEKPAPVSVPPPEVVVTPPKHKEVKETDADSECVPQWIWNELKAADADVDADMRALNDLSRDVRKVGEILMEQNEQRRSMRADPILAAHEMLPPPPPPRRTTITHNDVSSVNGQQTLGIPESALRKIKGKSSPLPMDIIKNLPRKIVNKLAACYLRNALKKKALKEAAKAPKQINRSEQDHALPGTQLFMQIENIGLVVEITKRAFSIGSGNDCDFKITDYVKCNRIEEVHAKMFFNPLENCFEILNYSSNGITVNNVKFGVGAMENPSKMIVAPSERQQDLEKMIDKRVEDFIKQNPDKLSHTDRITCFCKPFPEKAFPTTYEGSIKLHPGHRLEIGCAKLLIERVACT